MSATLEAVPRRIAQKNSDQIHDGKKTLVWLGVWEFNPRAIKFYTRYGFKKVGVHPFVLGNDVQNDWLMAKIV
jgi:ribosomal protein S18 acetylase RimI-like enzyme